MNIVTVFNYPDEERYNTMFKIWLLTLLKHKTDKINHIRILTRGLSTPLQEFIRWLDHDDIRVIICEGVNINTSNPKAKHNIGFKLWNMCRETEPYIFVDADMVILNTLEIPIKAAEDGYVIGVNHQTIPNHTEHIPFKFINTGFLIVPDPSFLDFNKIISTPIKHRCPGTDQMLIYNYLMTNQETYTHPLVDYGWNSCAGYKKVTPRGIWSDGLPENHPVHILHYWHEFKPWSRKCPIYSKYEAYIRTISYDANPSDILERLPIPF